MLRFAWWKNFIVFALLTLFLTVPAWGDGMPDEAVGFTDYGSFLGEYQAAGAFKFYDNTESILRLAQFELALMRYRFLKGQIQRKVDYRGLVGMVDFRLRFLKKQMHLRDTDIAAIPPRKARIPKVKTAEAKPSPKEKTAAAPPKTPGEANKDKAKTLPTLPGTPPAVVVIPSPTGKAAATPPGVPLSTPLGAVPPRTPQAASPAPPQAAPPGTPQAASPATPQATPPAATEKPPDVVVTDTPKTKEEKAEEEKEKEEAKPPPPPPSFWEKLKIRLHLKKQASEAGK